MMTERSRMAVFLDKDGTIIPDIPYNTDPDLIVVTDQTAEALLQMRSAGFMLIVVSNQAGVARGYFSEQELDRVWKEINRQLKIWEVQIDHFLYCPHEPKARIRKYDMVCNCRKPAPGMLLDAAQRFGIDLQRSWMLGDILDDIEAGNRAGCKTILINSGNETEWKLSEQRKPTQIVTTILEAAQLIINSTVMIRM